MYHRQGFSRHLLVVFKSEFLMIHKINNRAYQAQASGEQIQ